MSKKCSHCDIVEGCISRKDMCKLCDRPSACKNKNATCTMQFLTQNNDTEENRKFWDYVHQVTKEVARWPKWKRDLKITQYPEEINQ